MSTTQNHFLGLPSEVRNVVYGWLLPTCDDGESYLEDPEVFRRDIPILSDALFGKSTRNLRCVNTKVRQEFLAYAFENCKVIGVCIHDAPSFELVSVSNPIGTSDLSNVSKYELSIRTSYDTSVPGIRGDPGFEKHAKTAISCLPALRELTIRMAYWNMAAVRQSDPREYFMDNRVLSFQPRAKRLNQIKTIKKIVTVGFLAGYYDEDLYAGVFEYKYRVDELNTDTKKLEETSSFVRDGEFWDYIEDYKDWCLPYYDCLEDGLPFKQAHAKIKRMYDAWVESGKPTAEEMTQVKICKAIRRLKDKSASEFQNFVESFANVVQVMDSV